MKKIQGISTDAKQQFSVLLPNGQIMALALEFKPLQTGWFCSVSSPGFSVASFRVTTNPNILQQFSNLIPYGLACFTSGDQEPLFQEDFLAGNAALYLLDQADLITLEAYLASKA